jgi:hypothetical protein
MWLKETMDLRQRTLLALMENQSKDHLMRLKDQAVAIVDVDSSEEVIAEEGEDNGKAVAMKETTVMSVEIAFRVIMM